MSDTAKNDRDVANEDPLVAEEGNDEVRTPPITVPSSHRPCVAIRISAHMGYRKMSTRVGRLTLTMYRKRFRL